MTGSRFGLPRFLRRDRENRVLALAGRLLGDGRQGELERELGRLDLDRLEESEQESWRHLWGVTALQRDDRPEALRRFTSGYAAYPESMEIRFSLAQELQHVGRVEEAFSLLDACQFPLLSGGHAMTAARYAYLWGELERGLAYLDPVVKAYDKLGIVDDHFLYTRRLPFFGDAWSTLGALHELRGSSDELLAYTERAARRLRDYDFGPVETFAAALQSGDLRPVIDELGARLEKLQSDLGPGGYPAMRRAVLLAVAGDGERPHELLDSVTLEHKDFPWLEDIRTLAHAAIASREGEDDREAELLGAFKARQPLLFEPHHAFDFRLLDYQEKLRPGYQAACRSRGAAG